MPNTTISFGRLLIILGVLAYAYGFFMGTPSITALIPSIFGGVLLLLGYLAKSKENLRKHIMHGAVLIGLIGFIVPLIRIVPNLGNLSLSAAFITQLLMSLICLAFVVLCVKSFIDARKAA